MSICERLPARISKYVDRHYNVLMERARHVDILKLTPIKQSIQYASDIFTKAEELGIDDEKFVLYFKFVIYVSEKLPNHPSWSSVSKEQKVRLKQESICAINNAMLLKSKTIREKMKKRKSSSFSRELSIGTEFKYFNEGYTDTELAHHLVGHTARTPDPYPTGSTGPIGLTSTVCHRKGLTDDKPLNRATGYDQATSSTTHEICTEDAQPDSQAQNIPHTIKKSVIITATSWPDTKEVSLDNRLRPEIRRSISLPSLSTVRDKCTHTSNSFCPNSVKETDSVVCSLVAKINCACMLKSDKGSQTNESYIAAGAHKRYDAFLLYCGIGDCIGTELLQMLTEKGYQICTLHRENVLGEPISESYASLISDSSYVIAVVSEELLQDSFAYWLLDRAFSEGIWRKFNFLLPIVLDNCELPYAMKNIESHKVSDNKNPNVKNIFERLLGCLPSKNDVP